MEQKFDVLGTQDEESTQDSGDPSSLPLDEEGAGPTASLQVQDGVGSAMQKIRPQSPWLQAS